MAQIKNFLDYEGLQHLESILSTKFGKYTPTSGLLENGKIKSSILPSFVDDVLEFENKASFPLTGEPGKIYVTKDTNKVYRWSGTTYVEISSSLALGETSSTAYAGDKGKQLRTDVDIIKEKMASKNTVDQLVNRLSQAEAQLGTTTSTANNAKSQADTNKSNIANNTSEINKIKGVIPIIQAATPSFYNGTVSGNFILVTINDVEHFKNTVTNNNIIVTIDGEEVLFKYYSKRTANGVYTFSATKENEGTVVFYTLTLSNFGSPSKPNTYTAGYSKYTFTAMPTQDIDEIFRSW